MSMAVDGLNYQSVQELRSERKDIVSSDIKTQQSTENTAVAEKPIGQRSDTIEISEEGRAASEKSRADAEKKQGSTAPEDLNVIYTAKEGTVSVKGGVHQNMEQNSISSLSDDEKEPYETEDLSQYTDTELKLMYYSGDITLQDYEDETGEEL